LRLSPSGYDDERLEATVATQQRVGTGPALATNGSREPHGNLPPASGDARLAQRVVEDLFGPASSRAFGVRYWDGSAELPSRRPPFTLVIRRPGALRRMLLPPSELSIVEAYLFGDVDIEGDIEAAATLGDVAARRVSSAPAAARLMRHTLALPKDEPPAEMHDAHVARRLFRFGRIHTEERDAHAVRFHYDVGNDFYALWLDRQLVYSCAYFERGDESLEAAQTAKLDYVCRKLRLAPGERLLDIGCGWGALVIHAARHFGVRATGITLSEQQASLARQRVAAAGLSDVVTIEIRDYRTLAGDESFDKIASIGMVEHVGIERLSEYFAVAHRALKKGGLFLNHGIVSVEDARSRSPLDRVWGTLWKRDQFIRRYVFPDGDLVPIAAVIGSAEGEGFELRDAENLREHYLTTLRHWVRRLEAHEREARALTSDVTYRVWRLYMSAAAHGFRIGRIGIVQSLLGKPDDNGRVDIPRSRADLYSNMRTTRQTPTSL
jgi:cyclopropane-fatty-acyl-phospholipid synthase